MSIKSISHIAYICKDMPKSLHFYCDILGFEKAFEFCNAKGKPWILYLKVCSGQFIELFYPDEGSEVVKAKNASYAHLCLEVDDIHKICDSIRAKGYPIFREPIEGSDSNWQAWVIDPDGNQIEFMQIDPNSSQAKA